MPRLNSESQFTMNQDGIPVPATSFLIRLAAFSAVGVLWALPSPNCRSFGEETGGTRVWTSPIASHDVQRVHSAAFSPDGKRLATIGQDGVAIIWETETGRLDSAFKSFGDVIAFSPDGKRLAFGSKDGPVVVWDVEARRKFRTLIWHVDAVTSVAFDSRGTSLVSASADHSAIVWDLATGRRLREFNLGAPLTCAVFSPDDARLATASANGEIVFWSPANGRKLSVLNSPQQAVPPAEPQDSWYVRGLGWTNRHYRDVKLAFSPNGKRLISGSDTDAAFLWNAETNEKLHVLGKHDAEVNSAAFTPDGKQVLTQFGNEQIRLFDDGSGGSTSAPAVGRPHDYLATWDAESGQMIKLFARAVLAWHPNGRQCVVGWTSDAPDQRQTGVHFFDRCNGVETDSFCGHLIPPLAFSPDGRRIVAGPEEKIVLQLGPAPALFALPAKERYWPFVAAFSPDGKRIAAGGGYFSEMWRAEPVKLLWEYQDADDCNCITFSSDGTRLLACNNMQARLSDAVSAKTLHEFTDGRCGAFSPDGKQLVIGGKKLELYDAANFKPVHDFGSAECFTAVAFSRDGKFLAAGESNGRIDLWEIGSGRKLRELWGLFVMPPGPGESENRSIWSHQDACTALAFGPDGTTLISGGKDHAAIIWEPLKGKTGVPLQRLAGHSGEITSVWFSPDGKLVGTGARDGATIYWDAKSGEKRLTVVVSAFRDWLAFTPDGLVDGSEGGRKLLPTQLGSEIGAPRFQPSDKLYRPGLAEAILSGRNPN